MLNDRRLIEDFLPIQAISAEASREKSVRKGHISTLHLWWARRPLVACRAAVYGALVPASKFVPENGPDNKKQSLGRANAAKFLKRLCRYPSDSKREEKLDIELAVKEAQRHILEAHAERLTVETGQTVTADDIEEGRAPRPKVLDMFAGGGAIPLEALRLGCEAYALDLNPVAHIIELCTLVYPQKYGKPDPNIRGMTGPKDAKGETTWGGLADEVRYWGQWVLKQVKAEIGDLYPLIPDPDIKGAKPRVQAEIWQSPEMEIVPPGYLVPVAYLWTRTVRCKNPTCGATVPLVKQTWLCKKRDRYVALKVVAPKGEKLVRFELQEAVTLSGINFDPNQGSEGGSIACPFCNTVADAEYVQSQGVAKRTGEQLSAVVCRRPGTRGKIYLAEKNFPKEALPDAVAIQRRIEAVCRETGLDVPNEPISNLRPSPNARGLSGVTRHGYTAFGELFSVRQLLVLLTFAKWIRTIGKESADAERAAAIATCCGLAMDKVVSRYATFSPWDVGRETVVLAFGKHMLPMVWDYAEAVPLENGSGGWSTALGDVIGTITTAEDVSIPGSCLRASATALPVDPPQFDAIITDPPYYDNIPYADISDFFYVWMKRSLGAYHPEHFAGQLTPKKAEATALSSRYGGDMAKAKAEYESMMLRSFQQAAKALKPGAPLVIVYAHKTTLGWATLVDALRRAGFVVTEAWPLDTEYGGHLKTGTASLSSSIFLISRKRVESGSGSYEERVHLELEAIVRERVDSLWKMGITGADLVIAAVGAGLRAFTRFSRVEYANGEEVPAEKFLAEVEGVVLETLLEKIFGVTGSGVSAVDGPSRFYVLWRYTYKASEMEAGEAIVFTCGLNVELDGQNGLSTGSRSLVEKKKGKYRLLDFSERGDDAKLGIPKDDGKAAPLIDTLHRILWLVENEPRNLNIFLDEARPDRERLRLVAQALAGTALAGGKHDGPEHSVATTPAEAAALNKLVANWRTLIDQRLAATERGLFGKGARNPV